MRRGDSLHGRGRGDGAWTAPRRWLPWAGKVIAIVSALCLRLQANDPAVVSGTVTNADTGEALTEATVCAVYGEDWYYWTMTDSEGNYTLNVPAGENVVIGASYGDCISSQVGPLNIGSGASITQDFALTPIKVTAILGIASGDQVGCGFEVRLEAVLNLPPAQAVWYSSIQWGGSPTTDGGRITNAIFHDVGLNKTVTAKCPLQTTPVEITGIEVVQDEGVTITLSPESSGVIKWTVTYGRLYNCSASHPIVVAPGNTLELHLDPDFPDATDTALACAATHAYANGVPGSFEVMVCNSVISVASSTEELECPDFGGGTGITTALLHARESGPGALCFDPVSAAVALLVKTAQDAGTGVVKQPFVDYIMDVTQPYVMPPGPIERSFSIPGAGSLTQRFTPVADPTRHRYQFWAVKNIGATLAVKGTKQSVLSDAGYECWLHLGAIVNSPSDVLRGSWGWGVGTTCSVPVSGDDWDSRADDGPTCGITSGIFVGYDDPGLLRVLKDMSPAGELSYFFYDLGFGDSEEIMPMQMVYW